MRKCPKCQHDNQRYFKYCYKCGFHLEDIAVSELSAVYQIVFSVINLFLSFFVCIIFPIAIAALVFSIKATNCCEDAQMKKNISAAKKLNIVALVIFLILLFLFIFLIILMITGIMITGLIITGSIIN